MNIKELRQSIEGVDPALPATPQQRAALVAVFEDIFREFDTMLGATKASLDLAGSHLVQAERGRYEKRIHSVRQALAVLAFDVAHMRELTGTLGRVVVSMATPRVDPPE